MLRVEKINNSSSFLSLENCWNSLLEKSGSDNIFLTFEWLFTWWEVFGEDKELCLLLIKKEGEEIIGIAPLMISKGFRFLGRRLRKVEFIGSGKCDYHDFIIIEKRDKVISAIFDFFSKEYQVWDLIKLRHVLEISPNFPLLWSLNGLKKVGQIVERCPYIPLEKDWDIYFQTRGRNLRQDFRKKYKRLSKIGKVLFIESSGESDKIIDQFKQIHEKRFQFMGESTTFFQGKEMEFFKQIHHIAQAKEWLKFFLLKVDSKIIGYRYGFLYKQKFYDWITSFDPDFFEYSPGKLLIGEAIKSSMENNIKEFDFLRGDEEYKLKWADLTRANYELFYFKNNILGTILAYYYGNLKPRFKSSSLANYLIRSKFAKKFYRKTNFEFYSP